MTTAVVSFDPEFCNRQSISAQVNGSATYAPLRTSPGPMTRESVPIHEPVDELELLSAAKTGDHAAFIELCRRYTKSLKRRIAGIVRNHEDAEDILQDTLLRAYVNLSGFRAKCSFHTWITTIATNTSLMLLRKRRNRQEMGFGMITADGAEFEILALADPSPNPERLYAKRQASDSIARTVKMLPPGSREIVARYHQDEVRLIDAANEIGITPGAAKSRLLRARKVLRRHLKNHRARHVD